MSSAVTERVDVRASGHLFTHLPLIPGCLYPGWLDLEENPQGSSACPHPDDVLMVRAGHLVRLWILPLYGLALAGEKQIGGDELTDVLC